MYYAKIYYEIFITKKEILLNEREDILKRIAELRECVSDSKNNATPKELAEYLVTIKKLEIRLSIITEELLNKKIKKKEG